MKKKTLSFGFALAALFLIQTSAVAQSKCCDKKAEDESACAPEDKQRAGCTPSNCRGEQTKFGEAKVISTLRKDLISLKAVMEKYTTVKFAPRSYDIHGLVGETDNESLTIIADEVKLIEKEFKAKLKKNLTAFKLPENKAKQVKYLTERIKKLKSLLA